METIPKAVRFQISGLIGTVLFYFLYRLVIDVLSVGPTLAWLLSYMASNWWQFELHSRIVFLNRHTMQNTYFKKLGGTYLMYSVSMGLSTVLHAFLMNMLGFAETLSWVLTLVSTGLLNYFTVSKVMDS